MSEPLIQNSQRQLDILRQMRSEVHQLGLITDDEYVDLVILGSASARRLEDYDAARNRLALATEALAQREEELAAERRKNRELSSAIGRARELLLDSAGPFDEATMILAKTTTP